jgi:hypothetical protein
MTTTAAVRRKKFYTVLLDGWIDGRLYAAGQEVELFDGAAKYLVMSGQIAAKPEPAATMDPAGPAVVVPPSMNVPAEDTMAKLATAVADDQMAKPAAKKKPEDK